MKNSLILQAFIKYFAGLAAVMLVLFLPAGTFDFPRGWLFTAIMFVPMFFVGLIMLKKAPELLKKRLSTDEHETEQKYIIAFSVLMFVSGFVVAGLDFRFGWSNIPFGVSIGAAIIFLCAYALYGEVLRENAYLSRVVEVQEGQKVIDTGLYGIVRHPMYFATVLLFLSIPLVLGSVWSLVIFLFYPFLIVPRIQNEEKVLLEGLAGYPEYMKKVKYRMIPFIW